MAALAPDFLQFTAQMRYDSLTAAITRAVEAMRNSGLPAIRTWTIPTTGRPTSAQPDGMPAKISATDKPGGQTAALELGDGSQGTIFQPYKQTTWSIDLRMKITDEVAQSLPKVLAAELEVCRRLVQDPQFIEARAVWKGPGAHCLPEVPLVGTRTQLLAFPSDEVSSSYDDPEAFWSAGWSTQETVRDIVLLTRAPTADNSVAFLAEVQTHQWSLARAAKPGHVKFAVPEVHPAEEAIFKAGEQTVFEVGYIDAEQTVEFSCALSPGEHIHGWEIFKLWQLKNEDQHIATQPIKDVRVVFIEEAVARAEKRPLLDANIRVYFYDDVGELVELTSDIT